MSRNLCASLGSRVDVGVEEVDHVLLGDGFDVLDITVHYKRSVNVFRGMQITRHTELKVKGLAGDVMPETTALLVKVLHLLQALVD